jgi:hypothetical protein
MKRWTRLGFIGAAVVLAIAAGTAAYAMRGGDGGAEGGENTRQSEPPVSGDVLQEGDGSGAAGICLAGDEECVDTFDGPAGEPVGGPAAADCQEKAPCVDTPAPCPPTACFEPLPVDALCAGAATDAEIKECEARRAETAAICAAPEPGAPVTDCNDTPCVLPLPAPAIDEPATEPGTGVHEPDIAPPPSTFPCTPIEKCDVHPSEPAPVDDEGGVTTSQAPCVAPECASALGAARCLPPDCSVSSDGAVACPGAPPACDAVDGECSEPPSAGTGGGSEPSGGGSGGSGAAEPGVIEPSRPE